MKLGIDLDGVCYDFVTALRQYAVKSGAAPNLDAVPPAESWNFFKNQWGWTTDRYFDVFGRGVVDGDVFWRGEPYPGTVEALTRLREDGHRIIIVTHRDHPNPEVSYEMKEATLFWLRRYGIPYDALFFEGTKTSLGLDLLLDDAPHNIQAALDAGEHPVVFDQLWNRDIEGVDRVSTLPEFAEYVRRQRPTIIGLSGYAQAGKDTVGRILVEQHGFQRAAFADALKDVLYDLDPLIQMNNRAVTPFDSLWNRDVRSLRYAVDMCGWEWVKANSNAREYLQRLGVAVREHVSPDAWVQAVTRQFNPGEKYAITDVRFPNEAHAIVTAGGQVWRVARPGTFPINAHPSETALDDWDFNFLLYNRGDLNYLSKLVRAAMVEPPFA